MFLDEKMRTYIHLGQIAADCIVTMPLTKDFLQKVLNGNKLFEFLLGGREGHIGGNSTQLPGDYHASG